MNRLKEEWKNIKNKYESSKIISSKFVQNFAKYGEIVYLLAICGMVFCFGFVTTMMRNIDGVTPYLVWTEMVATGLLWIKLILGYAKDFNKLMLTMVALYILQLISGKVGDQVIVTLSLCILGAYEVSFEKILKVYVVTVAGIMLVAFALAQLGYIENLKYFRGGKEFKYALGGIYTTDTMCHILFLGLATLYLLKRTYKLWMAILGVFMAIGFYELTGGKTGFACVLLALAGCYVVKAKSKGIEHSLTVNKGISKVINRLMIWAMPIGTVIFIGIVRIYMWNTRFRHYFPSTIGHRIGMTARAIRQFGIPMWGSNISMRGYGGKTTFTGDYFFLDCSYVWVLFVYGLIVLLVMLGLFVAINYKFKNDWYMLVILFVIALDCTIEHHLMDLSYNIFMVALVANCGANKFVWKKKQQESV